MTSEVVLSKLEALGRELRHLKSQAQPLTEYTPSIVTLQLAEVINEIVALVENNLGKE